MSKTERLFHPRTLVIHPDFKNLEEFIVSIPERFQRNEGTVIHQGRNELRKMEYNGKEYVIKSFHSPHLINRFVYGIFRPSKAKRSYDHAVNAAENRCRHSATGGIYEYTFRAAVR